MPTKPKAAVRKKLAEIDEMLDDEDFYLDTDDLRQLTDELCWAAGATLYRAVPEEPSHAH